MNGSDDEFNLFLPLAFGLIVFFLLAAGSLIFWLLRRFGVIKIPEGFHLNKILKGAILSFSGIFAFVVFLKIFFFGLDIILSFFKNSF